VGQSKFNSFNRIFWHGIGKISLISGVISGVLSFLLMFLITFDVTGRYFFDSPITGTLEISRLTLAWICFLGLIYAYTEDAHVRVNFFIIRMGHRWRTLFELFACLVGLFLFGFLTWKSWNYFWSSWIRREWFAAPIPIPYWLAKLSVPVGTFTFCIALFSKMLSCVSAFFQGKGRE